MSEMAEDKATVEVGKQDSVGVVTDHTTTSGTEKKKSRGILSKIWKGIFRVHGDDFEKRLQNISKEEAVVLSRLKRRSQTWQQMSRNLIIFSVLFEIIAVGYAIVTTRSVDLDWKMRAFHVLPMFLLPGLSTLTYSSFMRFTKMRDQKDQKTLERLRSERQAKIDELKERTNYYITQQLIQKYDSDPAAKAAAASVLASKLGAEAGLKLFLEDESKLNDASGKSNDAELMQSGGLRNRKQVRTTSNSLGGSPWHQSHENTPLSAVSDGHYSSELTQLVVNHQNPQVPDTNNGGWVARIAALLVGEDPTQSYALICGNCHMHNGLAKREDFPYITYYCPHCNALNRPKQSEEQVSGSSISSPGTVRSRDGGETANDVNLSQGGSVVITSNLPTEGGGSQPDAMTKDSAADLADQNRALSSADE